MLISFRHILVSLMLLPFALIAQNGPGGTGTTDGTSSLVLWLSGDSLNTLNNGNRVNNWRDLSGYGHDATNDSSYIFDANTPTFLDTIFNGSTAIKAVRFDGDDYYDNGHSYQARTVFVVFNFRDDLQGTDDLGQIWGAYGDGVHVAIDSRSGNLNGVSFDGDGGGNNSAAFAYDSNPYGGLASNTNSPAFSRDQWQILSAEFNATRTLNRQVMGSLLPNFSIAAHNLDADIAELIVFDRTLTDPERLSVENYLSTKYGIDIAAAGNDRYAYDTNYPGTVVGIGRIGFEYDTASFSGVLGLDTLGGVTVDDGDFAFIGHDNGAQTWTTSEAPAEGLSNIQRIAREWRLDETNTFGTMKLMVDTMALPALPAEYDTYVLLVDSDGDFTNAEVYEMARVPGAGHWEVALNLSNGDYLSVGVVRPVLGFSNAAQDDFETVASSNIEVRTNFRTLSNVPVSYATSDNGATAGDDYTAIPLTAGSISAGSNSFLFPLAITNDSDSESGEGIDITLSAFPSRFNGLNNPLTYTIKDDDNPRKIYFDAASATINESGGSLDITVNITPSQVDPGNATTVDYAVTGGTATGGGVDFTLTAGTLNIPANNISNTFTITLTDDALSEVTETVVISLSNPTNGNLSGADPIEFTLNIEDNDPTPQVQFNVAARSELESVTNPLIPVVLSTASGQDVTVDYTVSGSATGGSTDFTLINGSVTIPAGSIFTNILPIIADDASPEENETLIIDLSSPTAATLGANTRFTYTILNDDGPFGFTGPGGVGGTNTLPVWYKADSLVLTDGDPIATWVDVSGNNNDATQGNALYQPTFQTNEINGFPVVRFDGTNDFTDDALTYNAKTIFIVFRTSSTLQPGNELGHIWGSYNELAHIAAEPRGGSDQFGYSLDGNQSGTGTARYGQDGQAYGALVDDGTYYQWSYDQTHIVTVEYDETENLTRSILGGIVDNFSVGAQHFGGDVAEIIVYDQELSQVRRDIVENYLSAKYGVTLQGSNDFYAYEATHFYDVAGVGQDATGATHSDATSNNIVRLTNPDDLGNGEYLLFGHDNGALTWSATETPADSIQRIAREWRMDETGEVGDLQIRIDTSYLNNKPTDFEGYVLLIDDNGDFSAADGGTTVYNLTQDGNYYATSSPVNISDGAYVSVGTVGITVQFSITSFSQSETIGNYAAQIQLSRPASVDINISYATGLASTATEGGSDDFQLETTPETITAGNLTSSINIQVNNDAEIELDETVVIQLSGADNNVAIGTATDFTLTIQDDDAANATGTGPGGVRRPSDYVFWLQADSEVYSDDPPTTLAADGATIAYWEDQSGSANESEDEASITGASYRNNATDNQNQKPVIDFSGGDLALTIANASVINETTYAQKTLVAAFRTGADVTNLQVVYEQGGGSNGINIHIQNGNAYLAAWDNDWTGTYLDVSGAVTANTTYVAVLEVDASGTAIGGYLNTVNLGTQAILGGQTDLDAHGGLVGIGAMINDSYFNGTTANESGNNYYFTGQLLELLSFNNSNFNDAQRIILENYLAGKWNINISAGNDIYQHKTTHSYGIAGIGQSASNAYNLAAQSGNLVTITNPTGMGDAEYLILGHDNGDTTSYAASEVPSADFLRLGREWLVSEQGDITGIKIAFDTTHLSFGHTSDFNEYALLIDADGDFTAGAQVHAMTQNGGSYEVSNIDFSDGDYFTFALLRPTVQFQVATASGDESVSDLNVIVNLNHAITRAISVDFALDVPNTTATRGALDDFDFADGTLNLAAGETQGVIAVTINDDAVIEGGETFEIDLSNPSAGLTLGTNSSFTYTIDDNDISTEVDFSVVSSSISEGSGSANITVKLNQIAASNVDVQYTVTGGTATGLGEDFTLADGTATIIAGALSTNVQLQLVDDVILEAVETVQVSLSNPVNASLGSNTIHTVSINDNDVAPEVAFSVSSQSTSEGSTPANVVVELSAVSGLDATVGYEVVTGNTTATGAGTDYSLAAGTLTIPAGNTTGIISVVIVDDSELEVDEQIQIRLLNDGNLVNATLGSQSTLDILINDNDASGFNGPGGVRSSTDYVYWLRSDKGVQRDMANNINAANNTIVERWLDFSGSNNHALGDSGSEPIYRNNISENINQKPLIDFTSGSAGMTISNADAINDLGPYTNKTIVAAFQTGSDVATRQMVYEQGGGTNGFAIYLYQDSVFLAAWENIGTGSNETFDTLSAPVVTNQTYVAHLDYDAASTSFNGFVNGLSQGTKTVVNDGIPSHGGDIRIGANGGTAIHGSGGGPFLGKLMELIQLNSNYNETQRRVLTNYLAAKYNVDISGSGIDYFNYQGSHSFEVAGLGRVGAGDFKTITQSDSMVLISNASALSDGDYLVFGHDNGSIASYTASEVPAGIRRIAREWRITHTGDLGAVTFAFDTLNLGITPGAGFTERVLLIDADGDFTAGARIVSLTRNGTAYEASNVDFNDGDFFTFAVIQPEIQFSLAASNGTENISPAQIEIALNYPLGNDVTVTATQTGGNATEGSDYTFADGTYTIPANAMTTVADLILTDDSEVESDETVVLTLSAPSVGQLGTNSVHTFSINDDDNFRKANFARRDSTDTEGDTTQGIAVFLNARDNVNATEVYIEVTGGTALNDSLDFYVQARDTLMFAAGDTVEILPINLIDDLIDENDETIEVSIVGGTNTTVGDTATFTLTIQDNDLPPSVEFVNATQSGDESFQTVDLALQLSSVSGKDITVTYGATGGDAVENTDFQFEVTSLVIPAGSTTDSLRFTVINDQLAEVPDETLIITLNDPAPNATLGANTSLTYTILDNDGAGFRGPGGVGNLEAQTAVWLRSDDTNSGFTNGSQVSRWEDQTNNNNDAFQATGNNQPIFVENTMNNRPAFVFDGTDDVLEIGVSDDINTAGPYDNKTIFMSFRTPVDINTRQMLYEEGGGVRGLSIYILNGELYIGGWNQNNDDGGATTPWPQATPPFTVNVRRPLAPNTNYFVVLQYDFDVDGGGFDGDVRASLNGENLLELTGAGRLFTHPDRVAIGGVLGTTVYHDISSSSGPDPFGGNVGELIVTNIIYNQAQRRIVYNYLSAKYDINIGSEDVFAYEATHGWGVFGIGRVDAANTHNDAQGPGLIRMNNPSDLGDNEFLLIGHDNGAINNWMETDLPNSNNTDFRRLAREWRASETGDVGNVKLTLSDTDLSSPPSGFPANYVLMVDDDGDFTSGASIYQLAQESPGEFSLNGVDLSGGKFFTIGLARKVLQFTQTTSNALENDSPASIEVSLNYVTQEDLTLDYTVADGTAIGGGTDYTLASGTVTISTGNQSQAIPVTLINDTAVENDENFTVTLSNPTVGAVLGTNTVHTFTINDSDQTLKVNLANADSTNTEDQTPILLDVFLSERDDINPTEVYYTVSGTASNGTGLDFELATPDTLTFVASDTLETISIPINDDMTDEDLETIVITLTGGSNTGLGDTLVYTYTIQDNDDPPTVSFGNPVSSGSEGVTAVNIPVNLSAASFLDVTVDYAVNVASTAVGAGGDYNLVGSSVTITAGQTTGNISLTLFNDQIIETDETLIIDISNPMNATLGATTQHTFTIIDDDGGLGPIGPGGVGRNLSGSEIAFWLRSDQEVFNEPTGTTPATNGDNVFFWRDQSGLNHHAYDTTGSTSSPNYLTNALNGQALIDFTRANSDDLLMDNDNLINTSPSNYVQKSIGLVFRAGANVTDRQVVYEQGGTGNGLNVWLESGTLHFSAWSNSTGWDYIDVTTSITANESVYALFELDQLDGEIRASGYKSVGGAFSGNNTGVTALLNAHGGLIGIGATRNGTKFGVSVQNDTDGDYFRGEIGEIVHFNERNANTFQQKLLASYYEGKYGISVTTDDIYPDANDATHPNDIFGIGRDDATNRHLIARSSDQMLEIENPTGLTDGEYVVIGHDGASTGSFNNTEVSMSYGNFVQRLDREWLVEEAGEIGNFRIMVDTTQLPAQPTGYNSYFVIVDNDQDGDFTDVGDGDLTFYRLYDRFGTYAFSDTVNVADGDVFTIAMARNVAINDGNWNDATTWLLGVPQENEPALLQATVTLDQDVTASQVIGLDSAIPSERGRLALGTHKLTVTDSLIILGFGMPAQDTTTFMWGTGTVEYRSTGDPIFIQPLVYYNMILSGQGPRHLRSQTLVENDFTINNNPCLVLDGNNLNIQGDWNNSVDADFQFGSATVRFNGATGDQTISPTNEKITFANLIVDKPSGKLILNDTVEVSTQIQLLNSNLQLGNELLIVTNNSPSAITGSSSAFIEAEGNGGVRWSVTNGTNYQFPIGDASGNYTPFEFQASSLTGSNPQLNLQVANSAHPSVDDTRAHLARQWTFEPVNVTSATYDIIMHYDDADIVGNEADLVPIKFNVDADTSTFPNYTVDEVNNTILWQGLNTFSTGTAGTTPDVVTPVTLLSFTGVAEDKLVLLNWETAAELNNDRFEIEWSEDASSFIYIGEVAGNGTTEFQQSYRFIDDQPHPGINYYRFRQVDYDGQFEYSPIIAVTVQEFFETAAFKIYPNPVTEGRFHLNLEGFREGEEVVVSVVNMSGQKVFNQRLEVADEDQEIYLPEGTPRGIYNIIYQYRGQIKSDKLLIAR